MQNSTLEIKPQKSRLKTDFDVFYEKAVII
jgi:hypothetical protein